MNERKCMLFQFFHDLLEHNRASVEFQCIIEEISSFAHQYDYVMLWIALCSISSNSALKNYKLTFRKSKSLSNFQ